MRKEGKSCCAAGAISKIFMKNCTPIGSKRLFSTSAQVRVTSAAAFSSDMGSIGRASVPSKRAARRFFSSTGRFLIACSNSFEGVESSWSTRVEAFFVMRSEES